ncbi:MAG TPA: hypothetical protein VGB98_12245 [Pyrinomonadaceae bacterium]
MQGLLDFLRGARFEVVAAEHLYQLLLIFGLEREEDEAYRHLFDQGWMYYEDADGAGEWRRDNLASVLDNVRLSIRLDSTGEVPRLPATATHAPAPPEHQDDEEFRWH